jgi:hypothetical protein
MTHFSMSYDELNGMEGLRLNEALARMEMVLPPILFGELKARVVRGAASTREFFRKELKAIELEEE